jgi:hypothetical protein
MFMRVSTVKREQKRLSCTVEQKGQTAELFLECTEPDLQCFSRSSNWIVPALLLYCMSHGEPLEIEEPISPVLLRNMQTIQDIYATWLPGYRPIQVIAPVGEGTAIPERTGLLFSRGVDSFYSLVKHNSSISDLIVLHGFEFPWKDNGHFQEHLEKVRRIAAALDKRLIVVRTNLKEYLVQHTHWDFSHGAALASAGLCLEGTISTCIVASTYAYDQVHPWGSHPLLDPLWSTGTLHFVHDGGEARRVDKLRAIADDKLAMAYLRACDNAGSSGQCGHCEKCLRTMVGLHVIGRLADCSTMPQDISPDSIRKLRLTEGGSIFFREFLPFAIEPPALRRAIHYALRNQRFGLRPVPRLVSLRSRARRIADLTRLVGRVLAGSG